jgi:cell division protein FtsB
MFLRARARAIVYPLAFYAVLGSASFYLVWGASNGERGLKAKAEFATQMTDLQAQLRDLRSERQRWERRVASMRSDAVDRDLLEEEARAKLDRVARNDLVIFTDDARRR